MQPGCILDDRRRAAMQLRSGSSSIEKGVTTTKEEQSDDILRSEAPHQLWRRDRHRLERHTFGCRDAGLHQV
jgi:hypothetical protein